MLGFAHSGFVSPLSGTVGGSFFKSRSFERHIVGPVGSGKTTLCLYSIFSLLEERPADSNGIRRTRGGVIRNTVVSISRTIFNDWCGVFNERTVGSNASLGNLNHNIGYDLPDGTRVEASISFIGLDDPATAYERITGGNFDWLYVNESRFIDPKVFNLVKSRVGRSLIGIEDTGGWKGIMSDSNVDTDASNWLMGRLLKARALGVLQCYEDSLPNWLRSIDVVEERAKMSNTEVEMFSNSDRYGIYFQPPAFVYDTVTNRWDRNDRAENLEFLPKGYYEGLISDDGKIARNTVACELIPNYHGSKVYIEFNEKLHTDIFQPNLYSKTLIGADMGFENACVFAELSHDEHGFVQVRIFDEIPSIEKRTIEQLSAEIRSKLEDWDARGFKLKDNFIIFTDSSSGKGQSVNGVSELSFLVNQFGAERVKRMPQIEVKARVEIGSSFLRQSSSFGHKPKLVIRKNCENLIRALDGGYQRSRIKDVTTSLPQFKEMPDKNYYSHITEAWQYLLQELSLNKDYHERISKETYDAHVHGYEPAYKRRSPKNIHKFSSYF